MRTFIACLGFFFLLASYSTAIANLVSNGSFELGPDANEFRSDGLFYVASGSTAVASWIASGDGVDLLDERYLQASNGYRCIDLVHYDSGGIETTVTTTPGVTYYVNFDMAGLMAGPNDPSLRGLKVEAAGQTSLEFIFDCNGFSQENMGWVQKSWLFVANDTEATIKFYNTTAYTDHGAALDNVEVTPEPATILLLTLGGLALRKRKHE